MSDTKRKVIGLRIRQLGTDYYICLAHIIEGYLLYEGIEFEKWKEIDFPPWEDKIYKTVKDLKVFQKFFNDVKDIFEFDEKGGVRDFLEINQDIEKCKIEKMEIKVAAMASIVEVFDRPQAMSMAKKLIIHREKVYKYQMYLNKFDENYEKDRPLIEPYLLEISE